MSSHYYWKGHIRGEYKCLQNVKKQQISSIGNKGRNMKIKRKEHFPANFGVSDTEPPVMKTTFFFFLGLHPQHMEVPRWGVKSELPLPAYATATAMPDPSHICDLHHSLQQCWILNPLNKAGDGTCILMDTSQVLLPLSHNGNSENNFFIKQFFISRPNLSPFYFPPKPGKRFFPPRLSPVIHQVDPL